MRRLSLSCLLSLLLVFAQHGAVLHELGHLSHAGHSSGATLSELTAQDGGPCASCEAYAQVANPAAAGHAAPAVTPAAAAIMAAVCDTFRGADSPTARSRGPPQA
jgi:hypothetical protein